MKTVHEFSTNSRMEDSRFEYSWMVLSLRGQMGASQSALRVEGLFESLLAEAFS